MESGSRSNGGDGFDDDDGLAARREVSSSLQGTPIPLNSAFIHDQFRYSEALGRGGVSPDCFYFISAEFC
jgi:hypothetical protein